MQPRYILENGRAKLNPLYRLPEAEQKKEETLANPGRALVCSYNIEDADAAADVTGGKLSQSTQQVIGTVQSSAYTNRFGAGDRVNGGNLLGAVSDIFTNIQAPIGLSQKLIGLQGYALDIKIDDSGSMGTRSNNGLTRWENVRVRLLQFINLLQLVPTEAITLSFLDRGNTIVLNRNGKTPEEFVIDATNKINQAFQTRPNGGTPIYRNVKQMLDRARGKTAHYLFTDGVPNEYEQEDEIRYTKDLLLNRRKPQDNPFTFLCCSDNPADTLWMHEIEEIACKPGAPGYVAAVQNFRAEQLEVLNDQGPEFPYSQAVWLLCNLTASLNPNDLDALDQHAPLSKPILDNILGRECTLSEYESYFNQHPNANWLFGEDYNLFLTTAITNQIPSVAYFENVLAQELNRDINNRNDTSEGRAIGRAEEAILKNYRRQRPDNIRRARHDYWYNHYFQMETMQARHVRNYGEQAQQDLWGDYVAAANLGQLWQGYVEQFKRPHPVVLEQVVVSEKLPTPMLEQPALVSNEAPPPYAALAQPSTASSSSAVQQPVYTTVAQQPPPYYQYTAPQYYQGYVQPVYTQPVSYAQQTTNQSSYLGYSSQPQYQQASSAYSPGLWPQQQQVQQQQVQQQQAQALQVQDVQPQQPEGVSSCRCIMM
jgi:hypothetical protein